MNRETDNSADFLPDRMDSDPPLFLGLSKSELMSLLAKNMAVGVAVFVPLLVYISSSFLFAVMGILVAVIYTFFATKVLAGRYREKTKGKPEGYASQSLSIKLDKWRIKLGLQQRGFLYVPNDKWDI